MRNRHTVRLPNWDYSTDSYYFVTICTYKHESIFGEIVNGKMELNQIGNIINTIWKSVPEHHDVDLDIFQIMPNHFHGILTIENINDFIRRGVARNAPTNNNAHIRKTNDIIRKTDNIFSEISPTPGSIATIIRSFKSKCSYELHKIGFNQIIWQRNYYEHIIRNEKELDKIKSYVLKNPIKWDLDHDNPKYVKIS